MAHDHLIYDACEACLGQGVIIRTRREGRKMEMKSEPCPVCEGLGFRRDTERVEPDED